MRKKNLAHNAAYINRSLSKSKEESVYHQANLADWLVNFSDRTCQSARLAQLPQSTELPKPTNQAMILCTLLCIFFNQSS